MTDDTLSYPDNLPTRLRYQFCPMCTTKLVQQIIKDDGTPRICCPACGWVHTPTNVIGVCTVVNHLGGIVAILPSNSPTDMPAAFPAGHCEYGESPEQTAAREVFEETGLIVEIECCLGWHFNPQADYPGPNVTFFFEAQSKGGKLRGCEEGQVAIYPLAQFPKIAPTRKGSTRAIQLYYARRQEQKT